MRSVLQEKRLLQESTRERVGLQEKNMVHTFVNNKIYALPMPVIPHSEYLLTRKVYNKMFFWKEENHMFWHVIQIALSYSTAGPCIFIFKSHRDCNSNDPNNNNTSLGGKRHVGARKNRRG